MPEHAWAMAARFIEGGHIVGIVPLGGGNINDTWRVTVATADEGETDWVLQRLNTHVFRHPEQVMANIRLVTSHIERRLRAEEWTHWRFPKLLPVPGGGDFLWDDDGSAWRALTLVLHAHTREAVKTAEQARQAGLVLGTFHRLTADLDPAGLYDTLPGFHITPGYVAQLDAAAAAPTGQERLAASALARDCLAYAEGNRDFCAVLEEARGRGELRERVIHGDPKITNIMFDNHSGAGVSLIDLDTVKPGLPHYDLGDCLRSCCNRHGEEPPPGVQVSYDVELAGALLSGYVEGAGEGMSAAERRYLLPAARLLPLELGIRFLADHLAGDTYFKIRQPGQNLARARVQFELVRSFDDQAAAFERLME